MNPRIEKAIEALKQGRMIVVTDHEDRENEGDLIMSAQFATPEAVNFMTVEGRGLICTPMPPSVATQLGLTMMTPSSDLYGTAFTQSIDHVDAGTGISAPSRSLTIQALTDPNVKPEHFHRPGHIFPLIARPGGVLERPGHTEASVDLMRMAGLEPVAVICEILAGDGSMARGNQLKVLSEKFDLPMITVDDVIAYRTQMEAPVNRLAESQLPTRHGNFTIRMYENALTGEHHPVLISEKQAEIPLVRIHSECMTGDTFGSLRCDCGEQLQAAMDSISAEGGVLIYLRQEGRGIGLTNKIRAYALQEQGADTAEANLMLGFPEDSRNYSIAAAILRDLGIHRIRLLTNNPQKESVLIDCGIAIEETRTIHGPVHPINRAYLTTKRDHFGHNITL